MCILKVEIKNKHTIDQFIDAYFLNCKQIDDARFSLFTKKSCVHILFLMYEKKQRIEM